MKPIWFNEFALYSCCALVNASTSLRKMAECPFVSIEQEAYITSSGVPLSNLIVLHK
jgi:hypothetical protein